MDCYDPEWNMVSTYMFLGFHSTNICWLCRGISSCVCLNFSRTDVLTVCEICYRDAPMASQLEFVHFWALLLIIFHIESGRSLILFFLCLVWFGLEPVSLCCPGQPQTPGVKESCYLNLQSNGDHRCVLLCLVPEMDFWCHICNFYAMPPPSNTLEMLHKNPSPRSPVPLCTLAIQTCLGSLLRLFTLVSLTAFWTFCSYICVLVESQCRSNLGGQSFRRKLPRDLKFLECGEEEGPFPREI